MKRERGRKKKEVKIRGEIAIIFLEKNTYCS